MVLMLLTVVCFPSASAQPAPAATPGANYPWHTGIVAATFWVGEVFDPNAPDGSQEFSTYDSQWMRSYGGCDGVVTSRCETERRVETNGYAPTAMTPLENPFYLDLPYDDIHNDAAFRERAAVIPWANDPKHAGKGADPLFSFLKNRWVKIRKDSRVCYGQIQDAGPGQYQDRAYVFGSTDARPANSKFNGAGLDVSPALNGCLNLSALEGLADKVDWQFVDEADVPNGPWKRLVTTSQVK